MREADIRTVNDIKTGHHLPPKELTNPKFILDLGANIGLSMIDYMTRWPDCFVYGIEMDKENYDIAWANLKKSNLNNCYNLLNIAVAGQIGLRFYDNTLEPNSYRFSDSGESVLAEDIDTIINFLEEDDIIDFIKMDIEGAEKEVLKSGGHWPYRTKYIRVELHDYEPIEAANDLSFLGFETEILTFSSEWHKWYELIGINNEA